MALPAFPKPASQASIPSKNSPRQLRSNIIRAPHCFALDSQLHASVTRQPALGDSGEKTGLAAEMSELAGVEGGGESSTAGHWPEASPGAFGGCWVSSQCCPEILENCASTWPGARGRWADDDGCWSMAYRTPLQEPSKPSDTTKHSSTSLEADPRTNLALFWMIISCGGRRCCIVTPLICWR